MHRARGLWRPGLSAASGRSRPGLSAASGRSRPLSGSPGPGVGPEAAADPELVRASRPEVERRLRGLAVVRAGFVSEEEAAELLREVEPALRRGRYQRDHWDRFCGCTIAGLSLLSPSVLRLRCLRDPQDHLELLLLPGSLYVLRGAARYEFTHEILGDQESFFGGLRVPRGRRVALIFRNDPPETPPDPLSEFPAFIEDPQDPPPPK